ncbi:unnamed protein product, partial [Ascophyllum nodosum]
YFQPTVPTVLVGQKVPTVPCRAAALPTSYPLHSQSLPCRLALLPRWNQNLSFIFSTSTA